MERVTSLSRSDAIYLLLEASTLVTRRQNDYLKAPFYLCGTTQHSAEPFARTPETLNLILPDPISTHGALTESSSHHIRSGFPPSLTGTLPPPNTFMPPAQRLLLKQAVKTKAPHTPHSGHQKRH